MFFFSQNNYKPDYCCVLFQCCRRAERLWPAWKQTSRKSAFVFSTVCTSLTCTIEGLTFWSVNWGLGLESPWEKFVMRPLTESAVIISTAPIHCWREYETVSGRDSCRDMLRLGGAIDLQALHTHGCSGLWLKWLFLSFFTLLIWDSHDEKVCIDSYGVFLSDRCSVGVRFLCSGWTVERQ